MTRRRVTHHQMGHRSTELPAGAKQPRCSSCQHPRSSHFWDFPGYSGCHATLLESGVTCACPAFSHILEKDPRRWIPLVFLATMVGIALVIIFSPAPPDLPTRAFYGIIGMAVAFLLHLMIYFDV